MNVLITNDDGPEAYGLALLQRAARATFPEAQIVTIAPHNGQGGLGMAITPIPPEVLTVEQLEKDFYICHGKPADLIYVGLGMSDRFLAEGRFDLVLTGVNHGQNIGMDVFHSGTVGMAMLASGFFGVPAVAFSQQVENWALSADETTFRTAAAYLPELLQDTLQDRSCRSINFPSRQPKGMRTCSVSMFSRFRPHLVPHNRRETEDVAQLEEGFITISFLRPTMLGAAEALHKQDRMGQVPVREVSP